MGALAAGKPGKAGRGPRPRRRGLFYLAMFLCLSGLIRLGDGVSRAMAETASAADPRPEPSAEGAAETPALAEGGSCTPDAGTAALLSSLKEREERLAAQEAKAAGQARALEIARTEIDKKIAALQTAEGKLAETLALADKAAEKDVSKLVAMYEAMKPKDAARLFGEMDPDFAAGFLAEMRPEAAATVMAGLAPDKAYAISVLMAGRNAAAPKS